MTIIKKHAVAEYKLLKCVKSGVLFYGKDKRKITNLSINLSGDSCDSLWLNFDRKEILNLKKAIEKAFKYEKLK